MGSIVLKTIGYDVNAAPDIKRAVAQMANGRVAILAIDNNRNDIANSGGDFTNVPRLSIFVSNASRSSSITVGNWIVGDGTTSRLHRASMMIDSVGNLHVVYSYEGGTDGSQQSIRYRKMTYASGTDTWTTGAEVIVVPYTAGRAINSLDITVQANSQLPLIAVGFRTGTGPYTSTAVLYNMQTAGTFVSLTISSVVANYSNVDLAIHARE